MESQQRNGTFHSRRLRERRAQQPLAWQRGSLVDPLSHVCYFPQNILHNQQYSLDLPELSPQVPASLPTLSTGVILQVIIKIRPLLPSHLP